MKLKEYIFKNYKNNLEFAKEQDVEPTIVSRWISKGFIVFEGKLYSERRQLIKPLESEESAIPDEGRLQTIQVCSVALWYEIEGVSNRSEIELINLTGAKNYDEKFSFIVSNGILSVRNNADHTNLTYRIKNKGES